MFQWRSINADLSMLYLTIAKEQINTLKTEIAALNEFILEFSCGVWPYLLKKSFIKNFIFCAVPVKDLRLEFLLKAVTYFQEKMHLRSFFAKKVLS